MHRNSFIACILTLTGFIILTTSLGTAQTHRVQTLMAALEAATARLGAPMVQRGDLYFGTDEASADLVDAVTNAQGGVATLFEKVGDQYVRVATTMKRVDGTSAVGTPLAESNPAIAKLNNGEEYYGDATVLGNDYDVGYKPIKNPSGAIVGAYFVGYPK